MGYPGGRSKPHPLMYHDFGDIILIEKDIQFNYQIDEINQI